MNRSALEMTATVKDSRWAALLVLCAGMLMSVLDATVVNVALPSIQADLHFSGSALAWVMNAYLIAFGGLLLLAGRLGDLVSRRGVFLVGLAEFTVASLACGAAQSQAVLVAARFVQGVGGAMTSAVILGMIVTMFPEPREQAKALGVYTFVTPAADYGWGSGRTLALGVASLALLAAFVWREAAAPHPLIPLRIFRSRNVAGANAIQALSVAGMFGMFFLGALYLRRVLGYGALETGLAFLPVTIVMGTLSLRYSERLATRYGAKSTLVPGLVLIAAGLALFARVPVHGHYAVDVLPTMILLGTGIGVAFPALMTLAMSGATPSDAGLASGLVNT